MPIHNVHYVDLRDIVSPMIIRFFKVHCNGKTMPMKENTTTSYEEVYFDCRRIKEPNYERLQITAHPKQPIVLNRVEMLIDNDYEPEDRIFCNGWQSWTESREYNLDETIPPLRWGTQGIFAPYGDYNFYDYPNQKGLLHSWSYSYVRHHGYVQLIGSLNEQTGFTLIEHNTETQTISIQKDLHDLHLSHSFVILDVIIIQDYEKTAWDTYFDMQAIRPLPNSTPRVGWTSWYNHYTNISADIILRQAQNFITHTKTDTPPIIQIDDGWQTFVGDWLTAKPSFAEGMAHTAAEISDLGGTAGLWLAPFICEKKSTIYKQHPDWLLRDRNGKKVKAGYNPMWSGTFYALDFYNDEVQNYLRKVLQIMVWQWGYGFIKLDFLYAACLCPPPNKTRGQVMHEAMVFIKQIIGDRALTLACGVPVAAAWGNVNYCRTGADTHLAWEHGLLAFTRNRERVSTALAVRNTIGRYYLNQRTFGNDPDVFILRPTHNKLTVRQRDILFYINALLGNLVLTSDDVSQYDAATREKYNQLSTLQNATINEVKVVGDTYIIAYTLADSSTYIAFFNCTKTKQTLVYSDKIAVLSSFDYLIDKQ